MGTRATDRMGDRSGLFSIRRLVCLLLFALLTGLSGCLVIEKKTLVLVVPPETKEVRMYYVFEGLSVLELRDSNLEQAREQMVNMKKPTLGFFANGADLGAGTEPDNPLVKLFRFGELRFYHDPSRKRALCADRRASIPDRDKLAKFVNDGITPEARRVLGASADELRKQVRQFRKRTKDDEQFIDAFGIQALVKIGDALSEVLEELDDDSFAALKEATKKELEWLRFGPETVRLVIPITPARARRIVADSKTKPWLKELRSIVAPLHVEAGDAGLTFVVGEKGKPIRLAYTDPRPYRAELEKDLARHAGPPKPILIDGKAANAERLIEQFIAEATKEKSP